MTRWAQQVGEPFRSDDEFWRAIGLSVDAFLALVAAVILTLVVGGVAGVAFVVPGVLLVAASVIARRSSARSREQFGDAAAWREAERRAVAAALPGAVTRRRNGPRSA
jgi:hypothetical protein